MSKATKEEKIADEESIGRKSKRGKRHLKRSKGRKSKRY